MKSGRLLSFILSICFLFAGSFGCSPKKTQHDSGSSNPNILLVTFDTTRADHIGAYGYRYGWTRVVDALAKESVQFNQAITSAPETLPAHVTIMTGLYPFYHGVRDNSHFIAKPGLTTLAEIMKDNGYETGAVVAAYVLDHSFGLSQGFETYDDEVRSASEFIAFHVPDRVAGTVTDTAIDWLGNIDNQRPYFLWAHYYDPHASYDAPASFTRFTGDPYDEEIAYADLQLGRLLEFVDSRDDGRDTVVVFTADHGEGLGQYGEPTHAYFAYESTLHVPLLIRLPGKELGGREVSEVVSVVDIMPTILDIVGIAGPGPEAMHGRSLVPLMRGEQAPELVDRVLGFESNAPFYHSGWTALRGVRVGGRKYIDCPKPELYLLDVESRETPEENRVESMPELAAELETQCDNLFSARLSFPPLTDSPQSPDQYVIEKLRALGYVAAPSAADPAINQGMDLKDALPLQLTLLRAMDAIGMGMMEVAAEALLSLEKRDPANPQVLWLLSELGATQSRVGPLILPTLEKALRDGHVQVDLVPQLLVNCGRCFLDVGEVEAALKYFEDAVDAQGDYAAAYWWRSLAYLELGRFEEAINGLRKAANLFGPKVINTRVALGMALLANGRIDEGNSVWEEALSANDGLLFPMEAAASVNLNERIAKRVVPKLREVGETGRITKACGVLLHLIIANCDSLIGDNNEAFAELQKIADGFPRDNVPFALALAKVSYAAQRTAETRQILERILASSPGHVDASGMLIHMLENTGELERATDVAEASYAAFPDDPLAANNLAWVLACQGRDLDRCLVLAKDASRRRPSVASVVSTLGWVYHVRGDHEMAILQLHRATMVAPDEGEYHYLLGVAYFAADKVAEGKASLVRAMELSSTPAPRWWDDARRRLQE